jgi:hypothetical protein
VPKALPVTIPEEEPIEAIAVLLLLHVPPVGVLLSVVVAPKQAISVPVMGEGKLVTVTVVVV